MASPRLGRGDLQNVNGGPFGQKDVADRLYLRAVELVGGLDVAEDDSAVAPPSGEDVEQPIVLISDEVLQQAVRGDVIGHALDGGRSHAARIQRGEVRALLDALPRHRSRPQVFWDDARDRPLSLTHHWQRWRFEAGLPGVRIHDLRHSFASHAAGMSETLPMIGKLLGHAKVASTARYAHLDDGAVLDAGERVAALLERLLSG